MKLPSQIDLLNALAPRYGTALTRDVVYGPNPYHRLDIYRPARQRAPLPVVVFFYGGSWQSGARAEYRFVGAALARLGLIVVVPDYRLYPDVRYPDFIHDAAKATAWVFGEIGAYGGNPEAVFVAGHSAGAYLAMMLALAPEYLAGAKSDRRLLAGAIGLAGPYDFLPITGPVYRKIFGHAADLVDTQPIAHVDAEAPPCLLVTGAQDRLVAPANTASLAAKLRAVGASVDTRIYPGIGHIRLLLSTLPPLNLATPVLADIRAFVAQTVRARLAAAVARPRDMAGPANPG
ncbi:MULTISPECIES: alpha/beta hydrolase [Acidiphilium]|uniref:alpha/beta hydrolase n=1 Tax=Acidiphilium TaxID=522 RepID=UPI00258057DE|nr:MULTISPECIES: alpha/beta hydrolase [Acidiphilium]HQT84012.1 alpha/beta hydrolase [Acidiphilium rubrum]